MPTWYCIQNELQEVQMPRFHTRGPNPACSLRVVSTHVPFNRLRDLIDGIDKALVYRFTAAQHDIITLSIAFRFRTFPLDNICCYISLPPTLGIFLE